MVTVYFKSGVLGNMNSFVFDSWTEYSQNTGENFVYIFAVGAWIPWTSVIKTVNTEFDTYGEVGIAVTVFLREGNEIAAVSLADLEFRSNGILITDINNRQYIFIPTWNIERITTHKR